jgi:hypothetical protein
MISNDGGGASEDAAQIARPDRLLLIIALVILCVVESANEMYHEVVAPGAPATVPGASATLIPTLLAFRWPIAGGS